MVVTSPGDGDGKTTTAANLAISLAQSGKRVLLIDCDYRGTKQQELFRLTRLGDSLKSVLLNDVDLRVAVRPCEVANLFLLPAGRNPVDAVDLLTRAKFKDLVAELKGQYEYVLLDAPPTTAERELKGLAEQADGMVLVVRGGPDAKERTDRATSEVARAGSKVIGAVVTAAPVRPTAPPGRPGERDGGVTRAACAGRSARGRIPQTPAESSHVSDPSVPVPGPTRRAPPARRRTLRTLPRA